MTEERPEYAGLRRERLQMRGRLMEAQQEAARLVTRMNYLRGHLRQALDPVEPASNLDGNGIAEMALELSNAIIEYKAVHARLAAIQEALQ